jgi:hypothetical protein
MAAFAQNGGLKFRVEFKDGEFLLEGLQLSDAPAGGWASLLSVYADKSDTPMLGTWALENGALAFRPRFPLADGVSYRAVYPGGVFSLDRKPPARQPETRIEHIYPSADVLPANELKLYIYFSAPMSRGEAWQHIHLLEDNGNPVPLAFLQLDQELWDPDYTRLTVLFDPGRIKRGLVPTNEIGSPIVEGKRYRLVIDRDWHDARGVPLIEGFVKTFTGGPSDRTTPDPKHWIVTAPKAGSLEPLTVQFPKPMDYALLQRMIQVSGVPGSVSVDHDETRWVFTPATAWKAGTYQLTADNTLEDIAGNHLDRPFDVDLLKTPAKPRPESPTSALHFTVR